MGLDPTYLGSGNLGVLRTSYIALRIQQFCRVREQCDAQQLANLVGDKRLCYVKECERVNITSLTALVLNVYIFGNLYY